MTRVIISFQRKSYVMNVRGEPGHKKPDCPKLKGKYNKAKVMISHVRECDDNPSSSCRPEGCFGFVTTTDRKKKSRPQHCLGKNVEEIAGSISPNIILADNQATVSIFNNKQFLTNIRPA